jgi:hypothetical protein
MWSVPRSYLEDNRGDSVNIETLGGGGVEHLHRSPASRRRRRKGNPVPGDITRPPYSWGI